MGTGYKRAITLLQELPSVIGVKLSDMSDEKKIRWKALLKSHVYKMQRAGTLAQRRQDAQL